MTSRPDFVEYARIRRENQPMAERFGFGAVVWAEAMLYNSVKGCREQIVRLEGRDYAAACRCALAIIERDGQSGSLTKKRLIEAALQKLDPAFSPAPDSIHRCHARGCTKAIAPKYLMCFAHWNLVPRELQRAVWRHYRPGQEADKNPTAEYLEAARAAIESVSQSPTQEP